MAVLACAFVFLSIVFVHCGASEPYCRQFEYDEKMLSKMIKAEIALEAMQKELKAVEDKLDKKIESAIEGINGGLDVQSVDGGWTSWYGWSACTASCGGGIQSRYRSCDNPARYLKGKMCEGPPMEYRSCATEPCHGNGIQQTPKIGFTVTQPGKKKNGALLFSTAKSNYGDDFDMARGRFVCEVPGLYLFIATIIGSSSVSTETYCRINVGSTSYTLANAWTKHTGDAPSGSASLVIQLKRGDEVYLWGCSADNTFNSNTHFSGALVQ